MRMISTLVACLALAAAAAVPASAATTKPCSGTFGSGFFFGVKATGVTCASARGVVRRWMHVTGFDKGQGAQPGIVQFERWTCQLRIRGENGRISCRAGARRVSWTGHP